MKMAIWWKFDVFPEIVSFREKISKISCTYKDMIFSRSFKVSSVTLTKILMKKIKRSNHLRRDMQISNNLFIVPFLASIFWVFVQNSKSFMKHDIVNIFIILNWESIMRDPILIFVLFSKQKWVNHIPACG